ncbi:MAG: hypothetical protein ABTS16_00440 [Candidatus Accumulibacter phosphatis]|uniref:hypothetical protein n=1 Tax=Candidatus Accumulibacter contiguus TaxID=2954381 RepID=UPI002FC30C13
MVLNLKNVRRPAMASSHPFGAALRQSRTLQKLDHFDPAGIHALAAAGLVLSDALNRACFVVNPDLSPDLAGATGELLDSLYALQDAVFGSADQIPAALAAFLSVAESGVFSVAETRAGKTIDLKLTVQRMDLRSQRGVTRIYTLAVLALAAMEAPRQFDCLEAVASALQIIVEETETTGNEISLEAEAVGCSYRDFEEQQRSEARAAVREHSRRNGPQDVAQ